MIVRRIPTIYEQRKQRVAAYARVSTLKEEQEESLEMQERFYTDFIGGNKHWEFVKVYNDEGRSGTSAEKRPGFQEMMDDALAGKIDIIFCKSISRFARNIVDAHNFVHQLKEHHVEVRFEKERLSSFDSTSDLVFNMLAAAAQEESRQISENTKWSYRKNAEKGVRHLGNNRILGYDEVDGVLTPNKDAWIVELIFEEYAAGKSVGEIVTDLEERNARRLRCDKPFDSSAVLSILKNTTYSGDRDLQKKAPQNYLTKKPDKSESYTTYHLEQDHTPLVDRLTWEKAQARLEREKTERESGIKRKSNSHFLYGLVVCGDCGQPYIRRTVPSGKREDGKPVLTKVWVCAGRSRQDGCKNQRVKEEELMRVVRERLGWGGEEFNDPETIQNSITRIEIRPDGIRVVTEKAA